MDETVVKVENRGAPAGKRPVTFLCISFSQKIVEKIQVKDQDPTPHKERPGIFPKELALAEFQSKYNMAPDHVEGPIYYRKGGNKSAVSRKRLQIDRDKYDEFVISNDERKEAIWGQWKGFANMLENNDEKAHFVPIGKVDADGSKKTNAPAAGFVNISDLVFDSQNDKIEINTQF